MNSVVINFWMCYDETMEFYDDMPATRFFQDSAIVLSGGRKQDEVTRQWEFTERIFYANYIYADKSISIGIFDDISRKYVMEMTYVKDYATAERLLKQIAKDYPGKVKLKDFLPKWKIFYTAMENAVEISSPVTDASGSCDSCGNYDTDEFLFLYVPAVPGTDLDEPSLGLHWEFGCYGGRKWAGSYDDAVEGVTEMAGHMEESVQADYKPNVTAVMETLTKLK